MNNMAKFLENIDLTPTMLGYICSNFLVALSSKYKNEKMFEAGVMSSPILLSAVLEEAKLNKVPEDDMIEFVSFMPMYAKVLANFTEEDNTLLALKVQSCFSKYNKDEKNDPFAFRMSQEEFDKFFNINNERKEEDE